MHPAIIQRRKANFTAPAPGPKIDFFLGAKYFFFFSDL